VEDDDFARGSRMMYLMLALFFVLLFNLINQDMKFSLVTV